MHVGLDVICDSKDCHIICACVVLEIKCESIRRSSLMHVGPYVICDSKDSNLICACVVLEIKFESIIRKSSFMHVP